MIALTYVLSDLSLRDGYLVTSLLHMTLNSLGLGLMVNLITTKATELNALIIHYALLDARFCVYRKMYRDVHLLHPVKW